MNTDNYAHAIRLIKLLKSYSFDTRLVGGCVRDRLLCRKPKDYDLATTAQPQKVLSILADEGIKAIPTGLAHGTITAVIDSQAIEITTLRQDIHTSGRHARVEFTLSFLEDAKRRDFTINAMYEDENGVVDDFFGGTEDLKAKKIRFVGDPRSRVKEDYLRILRYFRFAATLDFQIEDEALAIIAAEKDGLKILSVERIFSEMNQLFSASRVSWILMSMQHAGIFKALFATLKKDWDAQLMLFFDKLVQLPFCYLSIARWAYLFLPECGVSSELSRYILSQKHRQQINSIHSLKDKIDQLKAIVDKNNAIADAFDFALSYEKFSQKDLLIELVLPFYTLYFEYKEQKEEKNICLKFKELLECHQHLKEPKNILDGYEILDLIGHEHKKQISFWKKKLLLGYWNQKWHSKEQAKTYLQSLLDADEKP